MEIKKEFDAIIIGAGLGGLSCAALLSKKGYKVLLLERHFKAGGYSTTFERNGFTFDAAIHWINNVDLINKVLKELDALDRIKFKPFNPLTRIISSDYDITLSYDVREFQNSLQKLFPDERENIKNFINEAIKFTVEFNEMLRQTSKYMSNIDLTKFGLMYIMNKLPLTRKYGKYTAEQVVNNFFKNEQLKTLIHSLGTTPNGKVFPIFCRIGWADAENYVYPAEGGGSALAELLRKICVENGVEIKLETTVSKILIKDKKAYGVQTSKNESFFGKFIVSNADATLTYNKLIGKEYLSDKFLEKLNSRERYPSFCLVSMGTDYNLQSKGFTGETITYNPSQNLDELMGNDINKNRKFIHFRSLRDPSLSPPGCNTVSVGLRLPYSYENHWRTGANRERGKEYNKLKTEVMESVIDNVSNVLHDLTSHIKVKNMATPITFERYTLNSEGSVMGWEESSGGITRSEPIKNFLRVGHWSFPGGGTPRVLVSGLIVSQMIDKNLR